MRCPENTVFMKTVCFVLIMTLLIATLAGCGSTIDPNVTIEEQDSDVSTTLSKDEATEPITEPAPNDASIPEQTTESGTIEERDPDVSTDLSKDEAAAPITEPDPNDASIHKQTTESGTIEVDAALPSCIVDPYTEKGIVLDIGLGEAIRLQENLPAGTVLSKYYLSTLTSLDIYNNSLNTLVGLDYLTSLVNFSGSNTHVSNIDVIQKMPWLQSFSLATSLVSEIPDLSMMEQLRWFDLCDNMIEDPSPLLTAPHLEYAILKDNHISSVQALQKADNIDRLALSGNPIIDISSLSDNQRLIDGMKYFDYDFEKAVEVEKKARKIISEIIKDGMTELEKEYAIYRYQIDHMEFAVMTGLMPPYAYNGLIEGKGVCLEYADTFCMLCKMAGLDTIVVNSDTHSWNMIQIDGKYYHVDVLWDDGTDTPTYFNVGTDFIMQTPEHQHNLSRYPTAENMPTSVYAYLLG